MKVKRLVATAVAVVGAVAVALVPVTPASAHAGSHAISITGNMTIKDADWPDADDYAHVNFSRNLSINAATPSASARFTGCADEVRIVIDVTVSHNPSPFANWNVTLRSKTWLYEGVSCSTTDLDASMTRVRTLEPYGNTGDQWVVSSDGNHVSTVMNVLVTSA